MFYCYSFLNIIILLRNIYRRMGIELGLNHAHYVLAFTVQWEMDHEKQQLILGVAVGILFIAACAVADAQEVRLLNSIIAVHNRHNCSWWWDWLERGGERVVN